MAFERPHFLPMFSLKDSDALISSRHHQKSSVGSEFRAADPSGERAEALALRSGGNIPKAQRPIHTPRNQDRTGRRERECGNGLLVSVKFGVGSVAGEVMPSDGAIAIAVSKQR